MNFFRKFNNLDLQKTEDKKFLISFGISFFGIILLLVGTSYAYLTFRSRGTINTLEAASVVLSLPAEGDSIVLTNALPTLDSIGLNEEKTYTFTMKNSGTINNYYEIRLINNCSVGDKINTGSEEIEIDLCVPNEYIKVAVKKGNEDYKISSIGENDTVASGYISTNEQINFEVKIWLAENTPNTYQSKLENGEERNVVYYGKVQLYARQTNNNELTAEKSFAYTGSYQEYVAPYSGYYKIALNGAEGGNYSNADGGNGDRTTGTVLLNKGEKLYFYVGQNVNDITETDSYNGGGRGSTATQETTYTTNGGGATDVRYFGNYTPTTSDLEWNSTLGLNSRIMVAGGGAGGTNAGISILLGGVGGSLIGGSGVASNTSKIQTTGGTQTAGGSGGAMSGLFGQGGRSSALSSNYIYEGGGGGGYYGGSGAGAVTGAVAAASGGSSFISGYAGSNAITSSSDRTHTNNPLHYSGKYFVNGRMNAGTNSGNGSAKITYLGDTYQKTNTKLNNVRYIKDCINGSSANSYNHWAEIQAIYQGNNVAKGKTVTSALNLLNLNTVTDGLIENVTNTSGHAHGATGNACITVDLDSTYNLNEIAVWHYYLDGRTYNDHRLYVSSDNTTWTTLINDVSNAETSDGIRFTTYD